MPADRLGLVLYGPPASGKDTITAALRALDPRCQQFRPLKVGPGRTDGYRITEQPHLEQLRSAGELVWETHRYDATYAIDTTELRRLLHAGAIPVVHLAEPAAPARLRAAFPDTTWTVVALHCPRDVVEHRIAARDTGDTTARLAAYDAFVPVADPDCLIGTEQIAPVDAASEIAGHLAQLPHEVS